VDISLARQVEIDWPAAAEAQCLSDAEITAIVKAANPAEDLEVRAELAEQQLKEARETIEKMRAAVSNALNQLRAIGANITPENEQEEEQLHDICVIHDGLKKATREALGLDSATT
jgi:capsule polysaccharide export protein KpsE/RkpR